MPWWDYLYLRWPAQPLWGSLSPLPSHWRWPRDAPGAPGTAGYSGTQKPWGSIRMWSKRLLSDKRAGFKSRSISAFSRWRTCRPGGTRGSGRRRGRLRSARGHSPPQHCWGALQLGRTFLSSGPASACRGQYNRRKKLSKGWHIFSVCADAWIKTGYTDWAGIKTLIIGDKTTAPEFLQSPVMCGSVLLILHFNGNDGSREGSSLPLFGHTGWQQVGGQGRVESVGQQDELELHLWTTRETRHKGLLVLYPPASCLQETERGESSRSDVVTFSFNKTENMQH